MNGEYKNGDTVLGDWTLMRLIGEGSIGRVFEAEREESDTLHKAAIRVITIPHDRGEIEKVMADGTDENGVKAFFKGIVNKLTEELSAASKLNGSSNIAGYEEYAVLEHADGIGHDIIIRMELLMTLPRYFEAEKPKDKEVIRLGMEICAALELCLEHNVAHRGIKPENIFVSDKGEFKLGDIGIPRAAEKPAEELPAIEPYIFTAPEVYRGEAHELSADTYSLGLVMHWLLNQKRIPFLPYLSFTVVTPSVHEEAFAKRINGKQIIEPINGRHRIVKAVLKACSHQPEERYCTPAEMRKQLEAVIFRNKFGPLIMITTVLFAVLFIAIAVTVTVRLSYVAPYEIGHFEYEYDSYGNRVKLTIYMADASDAFIYSTILNEYEYDADGNVIKYVGSSSPFASIWERVEYEYSDDGNLKNIVSYFHNGSISRLNEYDDDGSLKKSVRHYVNGSIMEWDEYDDDGNRKKSVRYDFKGSIVFFNEYEYEYEYDAFGNLKRFLRYDSNGSIDEWDEYEYSDDGNLIKYVRYNSYGSIDEWGEYEYGNDGNLIKSVRYDSYGLIDEWGEYEYGNDGNLIKSVSYSYFGSIRRVDEYNAFGNLIKSVSYYFNGSIREWDEYDDDGNLIKYVRSNSYGSLDEWDEYEYDDDGNLKKSVSYDSNGSIDEWAEHGYDDDGKWINSVRYSYDGSILWWVEYERNADGNLVKSVFYRYRYRNSEEPWIVYKYYADGRPVKITYYVNGSLFGTRPR